MHPVQFGAIVATKVSTPPGPFHTGPYKGPWVDIDLKVTGRDKKKYAALEGVQVRGDFFHRVSLAQSAEALGEQGFETILDVLSSIQIPKAAIDASVSKEIASPSALKKFLLRALFENQRHVSEQQGRQAANDYLCALPREEREAHVAQTRSGWVNPPQD